MRLGLGLVPKDRLRPVDLGPQEAEQHVYLKLGVSTRLALSVALRERTATAGS